jgi:hypothetical protein
VAGFFVVPKDVQKRHKDKRQKEEKDSKLEQKYRDYN